MTVIHRDIEIEYVEATNQWQFTLRGRERKVESLAKAKETIDKPAPKGKAGKPFERIRAYYRDFNKGFLEVEVTSIADPGRYSSGNQVWCFRKDGTSLHGERFKEHTSSIYPATAENVKKIESIEALRDKREAIDEQIHEIESTLDSLVIEREAESVS